MKLYASIFVILVFAALSLAAQRTTTPTAPAATAASAAATDNVNIAKDVVTALQANDFAKAEAKFSPALAKTLTQPKLKAQWEAVNKQYGAMKEIKSAAATKILNADVVVVKCSFAKAMVDAQVGFDKQMRVTELYFKPAQK